MSHLHKRGVCYYKTPLGLMYLAISNNEIIQNTSLCNSLKHMF